MPSFIEQIHYAKPKENQEVKWDPTIIDKILSFLKCTPTALAAHLDVPPTCMREWKKGIKIPREVNQHQIIKLGQVVDKYKEKGLIEMLLKSLTKGE
jgi:hypothetical protein